MWSVLHTMTKNTQDLGLSYWGDVKLVKSQEVPLFFKKSETYVCLLNHHLVSTATICNFFFYHGEYSFYFRENNLRRFFDMNIDSVDNNNLYISANTSDILHANCIGSITNPVSYKGNDLGK